MSLIYKNLSTDKIIKELRNIRYANSELIFGTNNTVQIDLKLVINIDQLMQQADVFASEIYINRSKYDLKRFCGPYMDRWIKQLHEAYVYDRLKCIYYALSSYNMISIPNNSNSFPGNILLMNLLINKTFSFAINDDQPYTITADIDCNSDLEALFKPVFLIYKDLKQGISYDIRRPSYVNVFYEAILNGLNTARERILSDKRYKDRNVPKVSTDPVNANTVAGNTTANVNNNNDKKKNVTEVDGMIEMYNIGRDFSNFMVQDSNPLINSFLNVEGDRFFFILTPNDSDTKALRYKESVFISRAIGITSSQLEIDGNTFYNVAQRRKDLDAFAKEEVYAVTGLKSDVNPNSIDHIKSYLSRGSFRETIGGDADGDFRVSEQFETE